MLFNSPEFLIGFLPVVLAGYFFLAARGSSKAVLVWLTLASLVFYGWWNPAYLWLIGGSMVGNFWLGRLVKPTGVAGRSNRRQRWAWLVFGVATNLLALAYYKYANFFLENWQLVTGQSWDWDKVVLPLAISFFTFTQVAYLVDAWRGQTRRYTFLEYCFFVAFFPQLIAGPIVLHNEMMPQIRRAGAFGWLWENGAIGSAMFILGLFKKVVLADGCAGWASPFFDGAANGVTFTATAVWAGVLAYTFQLYFDFSGYSDMAMGLSRIFGLRLPINFASPYRATSIVEFWRRWHITLSRFLKQYLYIPLGGNRRGVWLRYSNLLITMLLGGLWHGAGWTFVIWGALHGLYLVVNHAFNSWVGKLGLLKEMETLWMKSVGWGLTMGAVTLGWVFFRASDLPTAGRILGMMFGSQAGSALVPSPWLWLATMAAIVLLLPNTADYFARVGAVVEERPFRDRWYQWKPTFAHGLLAGALLFICLGQFFRAAPTEFLYFNF